MLELQVHVFLDEMHGYVARAFDHDLYIVLPGELREFAQGSEFGEVLSSVVAAASAQNLGVLALQDPGCSWCGQPLADIDQCIEVGIGAAGIVDNQGRVPLPSK